MAPGCIMETKAGQCPNTMFYLVPGSHEQETSIRSLMYWFAAASTSQSDRASEERSGKTTSPGLNGLAANVLVQNTTDNLRRSVKSTPQPVNLALKSTIFNFMQLVLTLWLTSLLFS